MQVKCAYCDKVFEKANTAVRRSEKKNMKHFCTLLHAAKSRKLNKTVKQKKAEKAEYDRNFREKNADRIKKWKVEYFQRTYDPVKAAIERKLNMHKHIEYCRQPEYKKWKKQYDQKYRYAKEYGEYADCAIILAELEAELDTRELKYNWGLTNKAQNRKRQWQQLKS